MRVPTRAVDVPVTVRARGGADVALAWRRYTDLEQWPRWAPQIVSVDADGDRVAPGLRGTVHGPLRFPVRFEVDDVDELARTWSWHAWVGPVVVWLHHAVGPGAGGGSWTSLRMVGPAPVVLAYAPLARWAIGRLVQP